jgi:hypothetical protein
MKTQSNEELNSVLFPHTNMLIESRKNTLTWEHAFLVHNAPKLFVCENMHITVISTLESRTEKDGYSKMENPRPQFLKAILR